MEHLEDGSDLLLTQVHLKLTFRFSLSGAIESETSTEVAESGSGAEALRPAVVNASHPKQFLWYRRTHEARAARRWNKAHRNTTAFASHLNITVIVSAMWHHHHELVRCSSQEQFTTNIEQAYFARDGVRLTHFVSPVTASDRNDVEFGVDDCTADCGGHLL